MKTGKHYFGMLTEEEQRNFKDACEDRRLNFNSMINETYIDFTHFIQRIRPFTGTKQGHLYWFEIITTERTERPKQHNNVLVTFKRIFIYSIITFVALSLLLIAYKAGYDNGRLKGFNDGRDFGTMEVQTLMGYDFAPAESIEQYENMIKTQRNEQKRIK